MFDYLQNGRWWDRPWSLVEGCTPVSPGCEHCWSKAMGKRFGRWPESGIKLCPERLDLPLRVKKPTAWAVWNDLAHEDVSLDFFARALNTMACVTPGCGQRHRHTEECYTGEPHIFMILTKRPDNLLRLMTEVPNYIGERWRGDIPLCAAMEVGHWPLPNVWLGVTAENREMADQRIPILLQIPASVRFVSVEPMLGPVDFTNLGSANRKLFPWDALAGFIKRETANIGAPSYQKTTKLDWIICGGESGPGARPMHPDWPRSLRDQCQAAGVPFFFKHQGEWRIGVGKKAAGCSLDGREWNQIPEIK